MRSLIAALLLLPSLAHAQAPITRPSPTAWDTFTAKASRGDDITVRTGLGRNVACTLEDVAPDALDCHLDFTLLPLTPAIPVRNYAIPRPDILSVRRSDRTASALVGAAVGFGLFGGGAAANGSADTAQQTIVVGLVGAVLFGYASHHFPFIHHTLYRSQP